VEDIQARALVAFSRALAEQGLLLEAASVARLAAAGCRARRCRGEALVAGAEALLWRRQPHAATDLYAQALESDALWWRPQDRARVLFCYAMAAQEANRPRLCTTYLYQARAAASSVQIPLSSFLDVRCVTPQLGWVAASLVASGTADPEGLLDRVAAVSANYTASLDLAARVEAETAADGGELAYPTFLPEGARQIWFGGRGGEAWNEGVLARVQLPETTPVRKAVELWREWGVVSVAQILPEEFCKGLEGYFERVVGENSTMAFETGKPVAAHSSEELVLRDFILASLTEAGGDVALAVAALLDYLNPFLEVLELTPGSIVGLGQAAAYAGASVGPIRHASAPFTEQQLQHMQSASKGPLGAVALILLTDVPYRRGGPEVWPGAHLVDWVAATWSGLVYEDVSEEGQPRVTASVQLAGRRGDCFLLHPALPTRPGAYAWHVDDGLPGQAPTARWLEVTLSAASPPQGEPTAAPWQPRAALPRLHPELRLRPATYPLGDVPAEGPGAADAAAGGPAASEPRPLGLPGSAGKSTGAGLLSERLAAARRFGVEGAEAVAEALGWRPEGRRARRPATATSSAATAGGGARPASGSGGGEGRAGSILESLGGFL